MKDPEIHFTEDGRWLPVMEEFYSLQGEGLNTGKPAYFIRIGGCDVGCQWCDVRESWNASLFNPVPADDVVRRALAYPARSVVVTGGEPLLWNLDYLCNLLKENHFLLYLETSGSQPLSGIWDWICLSPKREAPPLPEIISAADELKVIIHDETDFDWAEECAAIFPGPNLILQPEWSRHRQMMPAIVRFILGHPHWRISLQSHKYMHIP